MGGPQGFKYCIRLLDLDEGLPTIVSECQLAHHWKHEGPLNQKGRSTQEVLRNQTSIILQNHAKVRMLEVVRERAHR